MVKLFISVKNELICYNRIFIERYGIWIFKYWVGSFFIKKIDMRELFICRLRMLKNLIIFYWNLNENVVICYIL